MPFPPAKHLPLRQTCCWLLLYIGLWWLLAGGRGWYLGGPSVLVATILSLWLGGSVRLVRLGAVPGFLGFFLHALVAGGWDVARRALQPRMPLSPAWVRYPLTLDQPGNRLLLASLIGLLPGTLVATMEDDELNMHVLDQHMPWRDNTARLEGHLLRLLGEDKA